MMIFPCACGPGPLRLCVIKGKNHNHGIRHRPHRSKGPRLSTPAACERSSGDTNKAAAQTCRTGTVCGASDGAAHHLWSQPSGPGAHGLLCVFVTGQTRWRKRWIRGRKLLNNAHAQSAHTQKFGPNSICWVTNTPWQLGGGSTQISALYTEQL